MSSQVLFITTLLSAISFPCAVINAQDSSETEYNLTVLNYNVFNGFQGGKSYHECVKWVNRLAPDIAGWQELVGWNEKRLQNAANEWSHPYAVTLKGGGYNIGLSSRKEITVISRQTSGFWHGYLHCRTYGIDIIVCHLWPGSRTGQLKEASHLQTLVQTLIDEKREVILMGDFNAHAQTDADWLNKQKPLIQRRLPSDSKRSPANRFIIDGQWNFDVMNTILQTPLIDIVHTQFEQSIKSPSNDQSLQLGSFPTTILGHSNTPKLQSGFLERIDFILSSPKLSRQITEAAVQRNEPVLEIISDHYPVVAKFKVTSP